MKKILALLLACIMLTAVLTGCGNKRASTETAAQPATAEQTDATASDGATYTLKLAHDANTTSAYQLSALELKRMIEEKSDGRIKVEVYPAQQLVSAQEMIEGMQMGTVEMAVMTNSYVSNFVAACGALDLPFVFESVDQAMEVLNGDFGQQLFDAFDNVGVVPLSWGVGGFRNLTTASKPVATPDDLKGMKIRCLENNTYMNTYSALGANPTPMSFSEVFTGLQQNVINGQENPPTLIYASGFQEVQKYLTLDNHVHNFLAVLTNENWLNSLSADDQQLVKDCVAEMVTTQRSMELEDNDAVVAKLQDAGMEVNELTDEQYQAFVDAVQPMYDEYKQQWGTEIFDLATSYNK